MVVVGNGAVGLMDVLAASQKGGLDYRDEPPQDPQDLPVEFGGTDVVAERGDTGVARQPNSRLR